MPYAIAPDEQGGNIVQVAETDPLVLARKGYTPLTDEEGQAALAEQKYGGVGGGLEAGAAGLARGATLGGSDLALTKSGLVNPSTLKGLKEANPVISGGTEFAGALLPAVTPGLGEAEGAAEGAGLLRQGLGILATPARLVGEAGEAVRAGSAVSPFLGEVAAGGLEGALYGGGNGLSDYALGDQNSLAESLVHNAGMGALVGAPLGAGLFGIKRALMSPAGEAVGNAVSGVRKTLGDWVIKAQSKYSGAPEEAIRAGYEAATLKHGVDELVAEKSDIAAKFAEEQRIADENFAQTKADAAAKAQAATGQAVGAELQANTAASAESDQAAALAREESGKAIADATDVKQAADLARKETFRQNNAEIDAKIADAKAAHAKAIQGQAAKFEADLGSTASESAEQAQRLIDSAKQLSYDIGGKGEIRQRAVQQWAPLADKAKMAAHVGDILVNANHNLATMIKAPGVYDVGVTNKLNTQASDLLERTIKAASPADRAEIKSAWQNLRHSLGVEEVPGAVKVDATQAGNELRKAVSNAAKGVKPEALSDVYNSLYELRQATSEKALGKDSAAWQLFKTGFAEPLKKATEDEDTWGLLGRRTAAENKANSRLLDAITDHSRSFGLPETFRGRKVNSDTISLDKEREFLRAQAKNASQGITEGGAKSDALGRRNELIDAAKNLAAEEQKTKAALGAKLTKPEESALLNRAWDSFKANSTQGWSEEEKLAANELFKQFRANPSKLEPMADSVAAKAQDVSEFLSKHPGFLKDASKVPGLDELQTLKRALATDNEAEQGAIVNDFIAKRDGAKAAMADKVAAAETLAKGVAQRSHAERLMAVESAKAEQAASESAAREAQQGARADIQNRQAQPIINPQQYPASTIENLKRYGNASLPFTSTGGLGVLAYLTGIPRAFVFPMLAARFLYRAIANPYSAVKAFGTVAKMTEEHGTALEKTVNDMIDKLQSGNSKISPAQKAASMILHETTLGSQPKEDESRDEAYARHTNDLAMWSNNPEAGMAKVMKNLEPLSSHFPSLGAAVGGNVKQRIDALHVAVPGSRIPKIGQISLGPTDVHHSDYADKLALANDPLEAYRQGLKLTRRGARFHWQINPATAAQGAKLIGQKLAKIDAAGEKISPLTRRVVEPLMQPPGSDPEQALRTHMLQNSFAQEKAQMPARKDFSNKWAMATPTQFSQVNNIGSQNSSSKV